MTTQEINGYDDLYSHGESNCCHAPIYDDSDICTDCKEHCAAEIPCDACNGDGFFLERIRTGLPPTGLTWVKIDCEECAGNGWIEE